MEAGTYPKMWLIDSNLLSCYLPFSRVFAWGHLWLHDPLVCRRSLSSTAKVQNHKPRYLSPIPFCVAESDCPWWTAERHRAWLFPPQHCFSSIPQALLPPHLSSSPKMLLARRAEWGHSSAMWQFQWSVSFYDTWKFSWLCEDSFADIIIYNFS